MASVNDNNLHLLSQNILWVSDDDINIRSIDETNNSYSYDNEEDDEDDGFGGFDGDHDDDDDDDDEQAVAEDFHDESPDNSCDCDDDDLLLATQALVSPSPSSDLKHNNKKGKKSKTTRKHGKKLSLACAIKALQCSPRTLCEDNDTNTNTSKDTGKDTGKDTDSFNDRDRDRETNDYPGIDDSFASLLCRQTRQQHQHQHQHQPQPIAPPLSSDEFVADFDFANFESNQEELISVSSKLELDKVLRNLDNPHHNNNNNNNNNNGASFDNDNDNADGLMYHPVTPQLTAAAAEIYTENDEIDDDDDENHNDNDNDNDANSDHGSDVISELCQCSSGGAEAIVSNPQPPADTDTDTNTRGSPHLLHQDIQNEFSRYSYSTDSNDTPVTCNRSLVATPKAAAAAANQHQHHNHCDDSDDEDDEHEHDALGRAAETDDNNFYLFGKPPKTILHTSLSLGDALSPTPTEDNDSPLRRSPPGADIFGRVVSNNGNGNGYSNGISNGNGNGLPPKSPNHHREPEGYHSKDRARSQQRQQQQQQQQQQERVELLQLPAMTGTSGNDRLRSAAAFHAADSIHSDNNDDNDDGDTAAAICKAKAIEPPATNANANANANGNGTRGATIQGDDQHDDDRVSALSVSTVSSFVFSSGSVPPERNHHSGRHRPGFGTSGSSGGSGGPRTGFFWKTHPCVTVKSYRFQQPRPRGQSVANPVRGGSGATATETILTDAATTGRSTNHYNNNNNNNNNARMVNTTSRTGSLHPDVVRKMHANSEPFPASNYVSFQRLHPRDPKTDFDR